VFGEIGAGTHRHRPYKRMKQPCPCLPLPPTIQCAFGADRAGTGARPLQENETALPLPPLGGKCWEKSYQFRLYRNDLTAKALMTRRKRRESLIIPVKRGFGITPQGGKEERTRNKEQGIGIKFAQVS